MDGAGVDTEGRARIEEGMDGAGVDTEGRAGIEEGMELV
jgi:uncharacterized membrane protein YebE (DUF533 family)